MQKLLSAILLIALWPLSQGFMVQPQLTKSTSTGFPLESHSPFRANRFLVADRRERATHLEAKKIDDGIGRGIPILGLVLVVILWTFTIPPEFRRAYICVDACNEYRDAPQCNNCVTGEEWSNGVKEYYRNGGGIQWDFSIDPNSKIKF